MPVCVCFPHWCKYVKHTDSQWQLSHTQARGEKMKTEHSFTFTGGHKFCWWNFAQIKKKQKMLKFDQAHRRVGATEGRRGKVWRKWHVSGSSALRVKSFTFKKKKWNGVTEESVRQKPDFGLVGFRLCKRIGKCVCAVLLIHFYFHSELSLLSISQGKCFKRT